MLELRPDCEHCGVDLAPEKPGTYICSYECTFCEACAGGVLSYVCPNCTGVLVARPPRPVEKLVSNPAGATRRYHPADLAAHPAKVSHRISESIRPVHLWEIVVDCEFPARLARFYGAVTGVETHQTDDSWAWIEPPARGAGLGLGGRPVPGGVRIAFQRVPEPRHGKVRLHIDLGSWDLEESLALVLAHGGRRIEAAQTDSSGRFIVCADPEGHEFCLVDA